METVLQKSIIYILSLSILFLSYTFPTKHFLQVNDVYMILKKVSDNSSKAEFMPQFTNIYAQCLL